MKWDKKTIIKGITELKCQEQKFVRKENYALFGAAIYHFGSWRKAVEKAGFNYDSVKLYKTWKEKDMLLGIKDLEDLTDSYANKNNKALYIASIRSFGSWKKAIEAAGFDYGVVKKYKEWTKSKILTHICGLKNMSDSYVNKNQKSLYMAAIRRFGTWASAIEEAGLDYDKIKYSYSGEKQLFEILSTMYDKIYIHHKFDWLVFKRKMHIDFYIPEINLAIERNGEQHYRPVCFGGISKKAAKDNLVIVQKRDKHKAALLKEHGVKLLIISYDEEITKDNIERRVRECF